MYSTPRNCSAQFAFYLILHWLISGVPSSFHMDECSPSKWNKKPFWRVASGEMFAINEARSCEESCVPKEQES